ncbi:hypothetical protein JCM10207_008392 [Rhodosporidiobolus poonsookiae]
MDANGLYKLTSKLHDPLERDDGDEKPSKVEAEADDRTVTASKGKCRVKQEEQEPEQWTQAQPRASTSKKRLEAMELDEDEKPVLSSAAPPVGEAAAAAFPTPTLTPAGGAPAFFPFPASPTAAANLFSPERLPPIPDAAPADPPSPARHANRVPIPLDRLVPVGTLYLPGLTIDPGAATFTADDGWTPLARETLQTVRPTAGEAEAFPAAVPPSPSWSRSPTKSKARAGTKRRASTSLQGSPASKRMKPSFPSALDALLALTASVGARGTVKETTGGVMVRVYLVPQDLPELADPKHTKGAARWPPASTVFHLLDAIRVDKDEWESGSLTQGEVPLFTDESDKRSLLEVYRDIDSPSHNLDSIDGLDAPEEIKDRLRWALIEGAEGVATELFPYQKATLVKLLSRELAPQAIPHPSYIRRTSILDPSQHFFVSLEGDVRSEPGRVAEARGGILAEDMGVGKTLIVLSLVLSTLNELPQLDDTSTYLDSSTPSPAPSLLTAVSLEFPFPAEINEAKKLRPRVPERLPGYMMDAKEEEEYELALAQQAAEDSRIATFPLPSLRSLCCHLIKTSPTAVRYPLDDIYLTETGLLDLLQQSPPFYRVFPSPGQLDSREGRKGRFKPADIVVAATTLVVVPTDLVTQWRAEIEKHIAPGALRVLVLRTSKDKFKSAAEMATYDLILMSVARFSDAAEAENTSLRNVHWKRLVVDEGHALASGNRMRKLAEELRCESRWAVSGTPTTNLRGGQEEGEGRALLSAATTAGGDRIDLDRLGQLFSRFVRHAAFPRPDSLRKLVQTHVLDGGERACRLLGVFNRAVVRHAPALVKQSFSLPPLTSKVVNIAMEEGERRVYNALLALFSSNSITSQRVDYLFHNQQQKHLSTLVDNLSTASTFFGSEELLGQLFDARNYAEKRLNGESSLKWTEGERKGLRTALTVMQEALDDRETRLTSGAPAVAFEVEGFPDDLLAPFLGLSAKKNALGRTLVTQPQLVRLRMNLKELRREDVKEWDDDEELIEEMITFEDKRKRLDAEPKLPKGQKPEPSDEPPLFKKRGKSDTTPLVPLPKDSVFSNIRLVRTTSAKINYIVDQLRQYPDEKFIIFSSTIVDIIFANLSETLDLLGISHAIFAGTGRSQDRGAIAQRFNASTAQECQAILVDARLGGRGITLTAASRVIMVEPLWKPDLEIQAQKRAHRLGQTKPVDLQVLVVKNTYEDALLQRRAQLAPEDFAKRVKLPQQDNKLRALLQSAQYLEPAPLAVAGQPVSNAFDPPVQLIRD